MNWAILIGSYGAILSTVTGALQVSDWRRKRHFVRVQYREYFGNEETSLLVSICNRGEYPLTSDYMAAGWFERPWYAPWRIDDFSLLSINILQDRNSMTGDQTVLDGTVLEPGSLVYRVVSKSEVMRLDGPDYEKRWGRSAGQCIVVEHSQSDRPLALFLR